MTVRTVFVDEEMWPSLHLKEWNDTYETLHMWTQIIGKVRMQLSPHVNHWWEVPLYVSTRGLTTSPIPYRTGIFELEFDFIDHVLKLSTSWGNQSNLRLQPQSVAEFHGRFMELLHLAGIDAHIRTMPVEVPRPIAFEHDTVHAAYDPEYAHRCWRILVSVDAVLKEFRARFVGKDSPVHFFWGSFDIAATRFSGRRAPDRPGADPITKEAYSHEVISGWWPGGENYAGVVVPDAAFYAYAVPEPAGFKDAAIRPGQAFYHKDLSEYLLMYEDARNSPSPKSMLMEFLQSTYDAGASLGRWDRESLERAA